MAARVTKLFAEVLRKRTVGTVRTTKLFAEVLRKQAGTARVTKVFGEVLRQTNPSRLTTLYVETLTGSFDPARLTTLFVETLTKTGGAGGGGNPSRLTTLFVEALVATGITPPTPTTPPTFTTCQLGYDNGGTWLELTNPANQNVIATQTQGIGVCFECPIDEFNDAGVTGLTIDNEQTALRFRTLTIQLGNTTAATGTLTAYFAADLEPLHFADANLPKRTPNPATFPRADVIGGPTRRDWVVQVAQQAYTAADATVSLTIDMDLIRFYTHQGWSGEFLVSIFTEGGTFTALGSTVGLVRTSVPEQLSGLANQPPGLSRADRCPRCGQPSLRETWIRETGDRSGYTGSLVCPSCWDEPFHERRGPDPEPPPIKED